ncbi:LysE family translocator [Eionea flava]
MDNYLLFILVAFITILSPGPGILLTLTNALRYGFKGATGSILGIAVGSFIVAGVSATSVGVILATSTMAFSIMKYIGAAYLIYMGVKLWRSAPVTFSNQEEGNKASDIRMIKQFVAGFSMQLTNPKAVFFFMSIFPQFIQLGVSYSQQFVTLVVSYSVLVVAVHMVYAFLAKSMRHWLSSEKGGRAVNRCGGGIFVGFGVALAFASR